MKSHIKKHSRSILLTAFFSSLFGVLITSTIFFLSNKIINASVLGEKLILINKENAAVKISQIALPESIELELALPDNSKQIFHINSKQISAKINSTATANIALRNAGVKTFYKNINITPVIEFDEESLQEQLSIIAGQVYIPPVYPTIEWTKEVVISKGSIGYELNINSLKIKIAASLAANNNVIKTALVPKGRVLAAADEQAIISDSQKLEGKSIEIFFEDYKKLLSQNDLLNLLHDINGNEYGAKYELISEVQAAIEREPKNPVFKQEGGKVIEFQPALNGIGLAKDKFLFNLEKNIKELLNIDLDFIELEIPVTQTSPPLANGDVNDLGIIELIGRGTSSFKGSISSRVFNIALAAEKINGALVAPGEIFSFNDTIGDISKFTGFKQSYIIQGNETILGDGGGVCQVSTTIFRAALDSGLPIVERNTHSYRVGYYEQDSPPGIDATIYTPTVDFQFKNDTKAYILVQVEVDIPNREMAFEFYGTSDGRESFISTPIVTDISEPPEDLYTDDPTRPAGEIEQVDYKAWGAKVKFDYKVVRDGKALIERTFYSNYRPWQAKFIRGTGQ